ncbi:YHS domain protein [Legionella geestiana]|uniref:YHS domain protein n=1 Tax=Legionella geestiana TaxID=45065 RepID=A0A0W0TL14_9GAMM|nr:YHS domain-containing (seleno)protein [Legionella geestiana]KTC95861.1 YHS domain protein [Legionella geestiana]QBS13273.1 YHS domain-containing protein [Legionella geestiana]QDQ40863.1 YHS domain-containing protein [Legionella geestiana]STX54201.1 YHS domain [Legionella geestiana]
MKRYSSFLNRFFGVIITCFLTIQSAAYSCTNTVFSVALQGYDVVSYFTENKPVKGNGDHTVVKDNVYYLFSSEKNKQAFKENPDKYLPQYGGWCAFATSAGIKVPSSPLAWKIVDGKLYLNLNKRVQKIWEKDIPVYIKKADINWPKVKNINPGN